MKKTILLLLVTATLFSCVSAKKTTVASPMPMSSNVVTTDDKDSNYIKANEWMVENFNNAESVIQFTDKEAGIIKGKYLMQEGIHIAPSKYTIGVDTDNIYAVITLRVKDERGRIEIALTADKYVMTEYGGKSITPTPQELEAKGNNLMEDFAKALKGNSANDTW